MRQKRPNPPQTESKTFLPPTTGSRVASCAAMNNGTEIRIRETKASSKKRKKTTNSPSGKSPVRFSMSDKETKNTIPTGAKIKRKSPNELRKNSALSPSRRQKLESPGHRGEPKRRGPPLCSAATISVSAARKIMDRVIEIKRITTTAETTMATNSVRFSETQRPSSRSHEVIHQVSL